jgi:hypothetical protein
MLLLTAPSEFPSWLWFYSSVIGGGRRSKLKSLVSAEQLVAKKFSALCSIAPDSLSSPM